MGLDLVPVGKPKPGFEVEHAELFKRLALSPDESVDDPSPLAILIHNLWAKVTNNASPPKLSAEAVAQQRQSRFEEISISPLDSIGAPRIGIDSAADAWIRTNRSDLNIQDVDAWIAERKGQPVPHALGPSDGVPRYSNGGLYDGIDATSFRGQFFAVVDSVPMIVGAHLVDEAWTSKMADDARDYGQRLLAAAQQFADGAGVSLDEIGGRELDEGDPLYGLDIIRSAARWHIFWGSRGHPIWAYF